MGIVFKNNAKTTLASNLTSSATSASVTDGSVFPSLSAGEFFLITFDDGTNNEICKCTARSGNTLTIVRAQESTTARSFSSGDAAEGRVTAGVLETIQENIAAKSANQTVYNTTTASSATDYDIGIDPGVEANAMVFLNGVMQHHDTFSFSSNTLTFDTAPPNGMALEVIVDNLINLQSSNLTVDTFTATSGQTDFVLSDTPAAETNLIVFVDGVFQDQDSYTISNNTLTITDGVVLNRGVTVYVINPVNIGTPSDGTVTSAKLSGNITMPGTLTVGSNDVAFDSPTFVVDNANSRVGLGTASPSVPVDIVGDVKMSANLTVDTSTLVVDATNNNVGIGTTSPAFENGNGLEIRNSSGNGAHLKLTDNASGTGATQGFDLYMFNSQGYIENYENAAIVFRQNGGESARFDSSGNFGIGTSSPNTTLTLSDGTDEFDFGVTTNQLLIKSVTSDGSDDQRIIIDAGNGGLSSTRGAYLALSGNEASSEAGKAIYQMGNVTGSAHVFRKAGGDDAVSIDSSGNVKIGTGSPSFYQGSGLEIERAGITTLRLQNTSSGKSIELSQDSDFKIETLNSSMDIVLYPTGNVGVGHASGPDYKLDVLHSGGALSQVVQRVWNNNTSWQAESLTEYYADTYSVSFPRTQIGFYRGDTGDNDSSGFIVKTGTTLANQTTNFKVQADGKVSVGHSSPDSTLHVKGSSQLNLMTIERTSSTPGLKFVNGADTAGTFGFQLMDNDEYWAGVYDGSNYDYWFKGNSSVFRVEKPVASSTDSGTRQYSHLCTGSFYSGTGAIVINTNIPAHNASGNANMFSIKIRGFQYSNGGQIDMNVGCYAGEGNYYSATYGGNHVPFQWRDEVHFAENTSTDTVAIILGTTSSSTNYEIAVVDFIQGFINVNESYAEGWTMTRTTDLSGYGTITDCEPRVSSPRPSFHAYLASSTALSSGVNNLILASTEFNIGGNYNTSNGRFTAPIDGVYQFNAALQMSSSSVNQRYMSVEVQYNGSTRYIGGWFNKTTGANNNSTTYSAATGSFLINMTKNDYVNFGYELFAGDTALGGNKGYTFLSGILIG